MPLLPLGSKDRRLDLWGLYLLAVTVMVPVSVPQGPGQLALIDGLNVVALGIFLVVPGRERHRLQIPFLAPVTLIAIGSLLAVTNAQSVPRSLLTLLQDAYLYLWFVLLVNKLAGRGRLRLIRITWIYAAIGTAILGLVLVFAHGHGSLAEILGPRGVRATSTFTNPNYYADYLVLSFFIALSAAEEVGWAFLAFAMFIILAGLLSTKSNGGAIALLSGLVAWALVRSYTKRVRLMAILGASAIVVALALIGWILVSEWSVGAGALKEFREKSFAGRVEKSSESRLRIWSRLKETYSRSPLGIGPGNSSALTVSVEERERPESLQSKEAHSDYMGYAIERGPLAFIGLLMLIGAPFGRIGRLLKRLVSKWPQTPWGGAFTAAMIGGLVASAVHSLVIEKFHFRHFWLYLAILCAVTANAAAEIRSERHGPSE